MNSPTFRSDRSWHFDVDRAVLWDHITRTNDYTDWWPWLRRFHPGAGVRVDESWSCEVSPPLPYVVRFVIALQSIEPMRQIESRISGDIGGWARLTLADDGTGAVARLESALHPTNRLLRGAGAVARPLVELGHDWVLDEGCRQFVERALK